MSVRLTPRGTRGGGFPNVAPWMRAIFNFMQIAMFRLSGGRMRVQGRPLLLLTTTGATLRKARCGACLTCSGTDGEPFGAK